MAVREYRRNLRERGQRTGRKRIARSMRAAGLRAQPMLQTELEHRGVDNVDQGFEAKLIAWLAVNAQGSP
jgi:hypothetical protein